VVSLRTSVQSVQCTVQEIGLRSSGTWNESLSSSTYRYRKTPMPSGIRSKGASKTGVGGWRLAVGCVSGERRQRATGRRAKTNFSLEEVGPQGCDRS
jgi:hypothetical protein